MREDIQKAIKKATSTEKNRNEIKEAVSRIPGTEERIVINPTILHMGPNSENMHIQQKIKILRATKDRLETGIDGLCFVMEEFDESRKYTLGFHKVRRLLDYLTFAIEETNTEIERLQHMEKDL
jgi:hypothetical protein